MTNPETPPPAASPRRNRASRYVRAQERRDAQKRADQRFYNAIFGVASVGVMIVLLLAALASNGAFNAGEGRGIDAPVRSTFIGLTLIEWIGLGIVGVIGVFMWLRIRKR